MNFNENIDAFEKKIQIAKSIRKFIISIFFNHQAFPEIKKIMNDKEKMIDVNKVNIIIGYLDNLIQMCSKLIEYGHTDIEFVENCMKLAAYILITDYADYDQELAMQDSSLSKGIWVI